MLSFCVVMTIENIDFVVEVTLILKQYIHKSKYMKVKLQLYISHHEFLSYAKD